MRARMHHVARLLVLLVAMSLSPTSDPGTRPAPIDSTAQFEQVRLRKLHLVRPDLIPYPISFEVYC